MNFSRIFSVGVCWLVAAAALAQAGSVVKVEQTADGQWRLIRDGEPYYIKGAAGLEHLELLAELGGNSIRTWGIDQIRTKTSDGTEFLDKAHKLGLTVSLGIWIAQPRHGFDYKNPEKVAKQRETVRGIVRQYKDHPALLTWSLGNEVEIASKPELFPMIFTELNELAKIVKEEDPNHPVMTLLAGPVPEKIQAVKKYYPELDILGINAYKSAKSLPKILEKEGWTKPYVVSEYGPNGPWEAKKTPWDKPLEPSTLDKIESYTQGYAVNAKDGWLNCLGSYAFKWGHKQEVTATWFGLVLDTGEKTPMADAISHLWTGQWPKSRSPIIEKVEAAFSSKVVKPGEEFAFTVVATDADKDEMKATVWVMEEAVRPKIGGDKEPVPQVVENVVTATGPLEFKFVAPEKPGDYRMFVKVADAHNGAAVDSLAFQVGSEAP